MALKNMRCLYLVWHKFFYKLRHLYLEKYEIAWLHILLLAFDLRSCVQRKNGKFAGIDQSSGYIFPKYFNHINFSLDFFLCNSDIYFNKDKSDIFKWHLQNTINRIIFFLKIPGGLKYIKLISFKCKSSVKLWKTMIISYFCNLSS